LNPFFYRAFQLSPSGVRPLQRFAACLGAPASIGLLINRLRRSDSLFLTVIT